MLDMQLETCWPGGQRWIVAFALALTLAACKGGGGDDDGDDDDDTVATAVIGPEGGSLTSTDGLMTIEVPPGAVEEETELSIALRPDAPAELRLAEAYELAPHDLEFLAPVIATLRYDPATLDGADESDLSMAVLDEDSGRWALAVPSSVDTGAHLVVCERWHFSELTLAERQALAELWGITVTPVETIYVRADGDDAAIGTAAELAVRNIAAAIAHDHRGMVGADGLDFSTATLIDVGPGEFDAGSEPTFQRGIDIDIVGAGRDLTRTELSMWLSGEVDIRVADLEIGYISMLGLGEWGRTIENVRAAAVGMASLDGISELKHAEISGGLDTGPCALSQGAGSGSVVFDDVHVTGCATGIKLSSGTAQIRNSVIEEGPLGSVGIRVEAGVLGSMQNTTITGHGTGVHIESADFTLGLGGNTISCNSDVDVEAAAGVSVNAQYVAWDHNPPEELDASDAYLNDYSGDVDSAFASLALEPCIGPTAPVQILYETGRTLPGSTSPVTELGPAARAPNGDTCFVAIDESSRLVCIRGGLPTVVLSGGMSTASAVTAGDDVVVVDNGTSGAVAVRAGGSSTAWSGAQSVLMNASGDVVSYYSFGGTNRIDVDRGAGFACIKSAPDTCHPGAGKPRLDDAGRVWYQYAGQIFYDDGSDPVNGAPTLVFDPAVPPPDQTAGETFDLIDNYAVGPNGDMYLFVQMAPFEKRAYYRPAGGGALQRVPLRTSSNQVVRFTASAPTVDAAGRVQGYAMIDESFDAQVIGDTSGFDIELATGDAAIDIPGQTYAQASPASYTADGYFGFRPRITPTSDWYLAVYAGRLDGTLRLVSKTGDTLPTFASPITWLAVAVTNASPGARFIDGAGQVAFTATLEDGTMVIAQSAAP